MRSLKALLKTVLGVVGVVVGWLLLVQTVVRIVRRFFHFPVPAFVARFIDNPFRRRIQPPAQVVDWVDIHAGMRVLEVGPGPGTFTVEAARRVGASGKLFALDIQPAILTRLLDRLERQGVTNVVPEVASAEHLPFADSSFDRLFLVTVLAEFPDKVRALREFARVLKDDGVLAVGELVLDPDYPRRKNVTRWCRDAGFEPLDDYGNVLHYVLTFRSAGQGTTLPIWTTAGGSR